MSERRVQRRYDHRLQDLVRETGDLSIATELGVPRSTAAGWLSAEPQEVISLDLLDMRELQLQAELVKQQRRVRLLGGVVGLLMAVLRLSGFRLDGKRLPDGRDQKVLLRAVERARAVLPLRAVLRVLKISASRFHDWKRRNKCQLAERTSCPRSAPNQLTPEEVFTIGEMVTSSEYRHVPTSRLAILAQRLGKVVASPSTWARLVRDRGWRRPRLRVHPAKPKVGLRTERPDEAWHVDTTVIRLLDGTRAYVYAAIDNFSRRILAFRVSERFEVANTVAVLADAAGKAVTARQATDAPMLVVDGGVENFNGGVDDLIEQNLLRRVLALTELQFSNSMIEAFWRSMKHQWLFLNTLDTVAAVRRHVSLYVAAHNSEIPHSAFGGQTPHEMYFGTGEHIPEQLEATKRAARQARLAANQATSCGECRLRGRRSARSDQLVA
jgi:putative transposase